jgi:WD40 repeat protein
LWNGTSGSCQATFDAHKGKISGVAELADGRLLSWSEDRTLRLWDRQSAACLAVFEGHTGEVRGALVLANGLLLSWSQDKTLRLWDGQSGTCLEVVAEDDAHKRHPEWLHARAEGDRSTRASLGFFLEPSGLFYPRHRNAQLRHRASPILIAAWNADSEAVARCLLPDGTAVITQDNGQVCLLKLYHGQRRVTLAEAEALLASQMRVEVTP